MAGPVLLARRARKHAAATAAPVLAGAWPWWWTFGEVGDEDRVLERPAIEPSVEVA